LAIKYLDARRIRGSSIASDHAQSTADTGRTSSSTRTRASQKIDSSHAIAGMAISNVTFTMEKTGSFSSGTCYARIYNTSNVLVGTIGSVDGATLTTYSTDPPTTDVKFSGTTVTMPSGGGYLSVDLPAEITFAEWNSTESNGYLSLYQSGSWVNFTSEALKYVVNLTDEKATLITTAGTGWTHAGNNELASGELQWQIHPADTSYYDLGAGNVSDTSWVLRFKWKIIDITRTTDTDMGWFGLSSLLCNCKS